MATAQSNHVQRTLQDPETYATTLLAIVIDRYGTDALTWSPETLRLQLGEDFGAIMPRVNCDRLMAGIVILTTDYFYKNLPRFIQLCNALSGDGCDPGMFDPADSIECAWGMTEAMLLSPPDEDEPFCDEIRQYITAVLKDEGYVVPPDVLRIAIDGDFSRQIDTTFSDDPVMFSAIYKTQAAKSGEVAETLRDNLIALIQQLNALPLVNGQTKELLQRLPAVMRT
jgi:hypothetical protein